MSAGDIPRASPPHTHGPPDTREGSALSLPTLADPLLEDEENLLGSSPAATAHMTLLPGYELLNLLGRGATSVVYKARHSNLRRLVALKMIVGGANAVPEQLMRFRIEAETVARLQHPNIVQIYEVGVYESCVYLALEYVEGQTLAAWLDGSTVSPKQAAAIVEAVARGMHHAHERGVVHRDLKPANILMTEDGMPKIADFGLAKHVGSESLPSLHLNIQGTPAYMAPEQASLEQHIDHATMAVDIYALGAILYELLTGHPPFVGGDLRETLRRVVEDSPTPPREFKPDIPPDLEFICLKCLQKDPHARYATAEMLAEDLHRFLEHQPLHDQLTANSTRWRGWMRRHRFSFVLLMTCLIGTLLFAGAAFFAAWWWQEAWQAERTRAEQSEAALVRLQKQVQTLLELDLILRQRPNDVEVLWQRAQALDDLRERQLALADCKKLLSLLAHNDPRRKDVLQMHQRLQVVSPSGDFVPLWR